jgi:hypothetical protein
MRTFQTNRSVCAKVGYELGERHHSTEEPDRTTNGTVKYVVVGILFATRPPHRISTIGLVVCFAAAFALSLFSSGPALAVPKESSGLVRTQADTDLSASLLDAGFRELYELNFHRARAEFVSYQRTDAADPLGKAAEAASYLFEQFNAEGVLTSAFFLNDAKLLGGVNGRPADNRNEAFLSANRRAREMAEQRLRSTPQDVRGLLVLTLTDGMEADYLALIEKRQLASLSLIRRAEHEAVNLLAVDPSAADAYVALGVSNYIIGCLPGYKRAVLWFGGIHGDRALGIEQMQLAAKHGHYLRPFAKILLALALERERQPVRARMLLADLAGDFPANPLFARELALLDHSAGEK